MKNNFAIWAVVICGVVLTIVLTFRLAENVGILEQRTHENNVMIEELMNNQLVIVKLLEGDEERAGELMESFHEEISFDEDGKLVIKEQTK